ncbi:phage tail length tape measure family protein [Rhodovulum sulfidophilum]|uniref:Phage tail length tape measure family protein n=1 Tax=Rhodovulum sulfidophilum TaxID=35806 RepID=A0ABS1RQL6_RHOSU|nr:phage tail length tape measure family protein [Rhodovulum sulfidophilum]MBL3608203.1 phage tail length tape measure family protein [Rhodovulum sulfidophilum]MCE8456977.1 phage tail length tape measure family protein [Rhodovulum sulfidophilum]
MSKVASVEAIISGEAGGLKASIAEAVGLVGKFKNDAEKSARAIERAYAQQEKSVDRLRKSLDPLYASSKRYESALAQLDKALKHGVISQAEYNRTLGLAEKAYLEGGKQAAAAGGALGVLGNMSDQTRYRVQNMGYQVQDIAVQLQMGAKASSVFAAQGSQIASMFGPVGAVVGTLAAVGLPLLSMAFTSAAKDGRAFSEVLDDLESSVAALDAVTRSYSAKGLVDLKERYGEVNAEILTLIERQKQVAIADAVRDADAAAQGFADQLERISDLVARAEYQFSPIEKLNEEFGLTLGTAQQLKIAFDQLAAAKTFDGQADAMARILSLMEGTKLETDEVFKELVRAEGAMRQLAASAPQAGWMSGAIAEVKTLATALWDAAKARAAAEGAANTDAAGNPIQPGVSRTSRPRAAPPGTGGVEWGTPPQSGGGGGGANKVQTDLDALRQSLMTQEELQIASYDRQRETLLQARQQELIDQQEYDALIEQTRQQHQDRMAQIDAYRYGNGLQMTEAFLGDMASAFATGGDKMVKISRIFGAAQALISTYVGAAEALKLPFPENIAAAAKVIATGMSFVSAIKSGSKSAAGAGRASSAGAAAQAAAPAPQRTANVTVQGDVIGRQSGEALVKALNEAFGDGYRLNLDWQGAAG